MKKKRGIQRTISMLIIGISLTAVTVVAAVSLADMVSIRSDVTVTSGHFGEAAADTGKTALELQTIERLKDMAVSKAEVSDEKLGRIQNYVNIIAENAGEIYADMQGYPKGELRFPSAADDGLDELQCMFAPDADLRNPELMDEALRLTNIQHILKYIMHETTSVTSAYVGNEKGMWYVVDRHSGSKSLDSDARKRPWYIAAKEAGEPVWTDVVDDLWGRGLGIIRAAPFYSPDGEFIGAAGIGTLLQPLSDYILGSAVGETGYSFVINERAEKVIATNLEKDAENQIIRQSLLDDEDEQFNSIINRIISEKTSGVEKVMFDGRMVYMAYAPMDTVSWTVISVIDVEEAILPATEISNNIIALSDGIIVGINSRIYSSILRTVIFVIAAIIITLMLSIVMSRRITKPIETLSNGVEEISGGNLELRLDIKTGNEIEDLADSFNKMVSDLKLYIEDLARTTADKERIGAELNIATRIQASMLPSIFPPFPDRPEFDIYATMLPAKEVGGDFYDFFLIDEQKLAVVMADVSGKGVPAALFMVIAKTLIKNNAQYGKNPEEVFETVNNLLCENNEADMFVTAFLGYLDIPTGTFTYVNAGHNPPLLKREGGQFEWLPIKPGFVLAGMEDMRYKQDKIQLNPGDTLYLYTDGVTEAVDRENRLFTETRLLDVLDASRDCGLKELLVTVKREIDQFAGGAEQADDITMLALKITGGAK